MSESLWIMRHGEAAPGWPDAQRELTVHGQQEVVRMAEWLTSTLEEQRLERLHIAASPYVRARQTAAIVAERLGRPVDTLPLITPNDPPEPVIDWLQHNADGVPWLLVSHMPLVGALTGRLIEGGIRSSLAMPTAAIAALEADVWAAGCARLTALRHPAAPG